MTTLQELMKEIKNLKPIPAVTNQLLAVVDNPDSSMEDIANVIQYDPAITASVLKSCNSAFFGLKNPAESIKDAVNILTAPCCFSGSNKNRSQFFCFLEQLPGSSLQLFTINTHRNK